MSRSTWTKLILFVLLATAAYLGLRALGIDVTRLTPQRVRAVVLSFGIFAPLAYVVVYSQPIIPIPATVLMMAGGCSSSPCGVSL